MDAAGGMLTAWMKPENVVGFPEDHVQRADRHPMDWIAGWIVAKGWGKPTHRRRARSLLLLAEGACAAGRRPAQCEMARRRPPGELGPRGQIPGRNRLSAQGVDGWPKRRLRAAYEVIAPGVRECDAIAAIQAAQIAGQPGFCRRHHGAAADDPRRRECFRAAHHVERPAVRRGRDDRARTGRRLPPLRRRPRADDAARQDADRRSRRPAKAVIEGMEAVLDAVRPGTPPKPSRPPGASVIARYGLKKESRIGYSIGVAYPPDWGEHTISLRPGDKTVLAARQCLPRHPRHVDGWLGHRDQRDHSGDRDRQRDADQIPARHPCQILTAGQRRRRADIDAGHSRPDDRDPPPSAPPSRAVEPRRLARKPISGRCWPGRGLRHPRRRRLRPGRRYRRHRQAVKPQGGHTRRHRCLADRGRVRRRLRLAKTRA